MDSIRGGAAELRGDEARHLTRVLRVEPGQRFEISDNQQAYLAEIAEARGERVVFHVIEALPPSPFPVSITLCASLIKFDRFEWIIEKATELGVDRILPVEAARTEKGLFDASRKRSERWARIARESSQQSRRVRIPEILPAVRFERCLAADRRSPLLPGRSRGPAAAARNSGGALRLRSPADRSRRRLDRYRTALAIAAALAAGLAWTPGASCGNSRLRRPGHSRECLADLTAVLRPREKPT